MKLILKLVLVFGMLAMFVQASSADPRNERLERREVRQAMRIHQGWMNGRLTRDERLRLRMGQMRMHAMQRRMMADGDLSFRERARMEGMLDRQSGRIYRLKHNGRWI